MEGGHTSAFPTPYQCWERSRQSLSIRVRRRRRPLVVDVCWARGEVVALSVIDLPLCVHRHGCLPWSWNLFYGSGESQRRNPESTIPECLFSTLVRLSINIEALRTRETLSRTGRERKGKRRLWTWAGSGGESMFGTRCPNTYMWLSSRQSKKQIEDDVVSCPRNPREPRDFILRSSFAVCQGIQRRAAEHYHPWILDDARSGKKASIFFRKCNKNNVHYCYCASPARITRGNQPQKKRFVPFGSDGERRATSVLRDMLKPFHSWRNSHATDVCLFAFAELFLCLHCLCGCFSSRACGINIVRMKINPFSVCYILLITVLKSGAREEWWLPRKLDASTSSKNSNYSCQLFPRNPFFICVLATLQ